MPAVSNKRYPSVSPPGRAPVKRKVPSVSGILVSPWISMGCSVPSSSTRTADSQPMYVIVSSETVNICRNQITAAHSARKISGQRM